MNAAVRNRTAGDELGLSRMARRVSKARLLSWWRSSRRARTNSARERWRAAEKGW
jgi:hypothetical protein